MKLNWRKCTPPAFDNIPDKAGVYIISTIQKSDNRYEAKFIGKALDLKAAAIKHWSDQEANKGLKTHISKGYHMKLSYAEVEKASDREGIEYFLVNTLKPAFNDKKMPAKAPVVVNLPNVRGGKVTAKPIAKAVTKPIAAPVAKPVVKPVEASAAKPVAKPVAKASAKPAVKVAPKKTVSKAK
jgi:hypothetical protein